MQNEKKALSMSLLVQRWQQSGKTQKQFSEENHIKLATFIYSAVLHHERLEDSIVHRVYTEQNILSVTKHQCHHRSEKQQ